jgi:hypothetical protein
MLAILFFSLNFPRPLFFGRQGFVVEAAYSDDSPELVVLDSTV